jgi:hypothetical protein
VTPGFIRTAACAVIAVLALALAPGAFAASEVGDAGDLRVTANDMGNSAVSSITGSYADAADADVYRICLTDGLSFSATSVAFAASSDGASAPTTLDTQMFLFDSQGYGVYANDDWNGSRSSKLPAQHRFSPRAGGEYFLAISQYNRDPQSSQGEIFQDNYSRLLFPDGVLYANGFGGAETLSDWNGRAPGSAGIYTITLTGTKSCVPPDTTPPTVDLRSPADGARVKQGAEVVVDFSCADEGSSGLASCVGSTADADQLDTSRLGNVSVTVTARDRAGNQTVVTNTVTVVDETKPTATISTPADGAVYTRGQAVTADYACADEAGGSGIESCAGDVADGAGVDTSTLGEHTFTVHAADRAGNTETASATYSVVDSTAPTIALTTPASNGVYALGQQVAADYSCADETGGSGLAGCSGTVADGDAIDTSSVGEKQFKVEATDNAGNRASKSVGYTVVDRTPPTIAVHAPVDGGAYSLGQQVLASYSCADQPGGSGVASCEGSVPNGQLIDTSSFGTHTFEVHAADGAGNPASATVTYSVQYDFEGFFRPVRNPPGMNRRRAGATVALRFSLNGYQGRRPEADGYPRSTSCSGGDAEQAARGAGRRPAFEYERGSDRYTLLWKTDRDWAGSCREFVLRLDDGSVHTARFKFVKRRKRD